MRKKLTEKRKEIIWTMIDNFQIARFEMECFEEFEKDEVRIALDLVIKRLKLD